MTQARIPTVRSEVFLRYLCINISLKFSPDKKPQMKKMEAEPLIIQDADRFPLLNW